MMTGRWFSAFLGIGVALCALADAEAQTPPTFDPGIFDTRVELEERLRMYEDANAPGYTAETRARGRQEIELIRSRLDEGDFQVGDKIDLVVTGEQDLTSSFTVAQGQVIHLSPEWTVPLRGVLRSELQNHIHEFLKLYIRRPDIRVNNSTIRITVGGDGVGASQFIDAPADSRLIDVITTAGLTPNAKIEEIRIERSGEEIWSGDPLYHVAITEGRTLDQLSLRAGDRIQVPASGGGFKAIDVLRALPYIITLGFAISRIL
jgi:hypothetical protein